MRTRVFTIPPSAPFLPTLIKAMTGGKLGFRLADDPLALAAVTLYLPTRRACRLARDAFLDALKIDAAILPRIVAIGDIDEDEIAFAEAARAPSPPMRWRCRRRSAASNGVCCWRNWCANGRTRRKSAARSGMPLVAQTPAAACALADDLARLIDDMTMRGVSWDKLDGLVPDFLDQYWQLTLKFLELARSNWPAILRRARIHRTGKAPRRADQGRSRAACAQDRLRR